MSPTVEYSPITTDEEEAHFKSALVTLETYWFDSNNRAAWKQYLVQLLSSSHNPYIAALTLTTLSRDYYSGKGNGCANNLMVEFSEWIFHRSADYCDCLTKSVQLSAFTLGIKQKNSSLFHLISTVYKLHQQKHVLIDHVHYYINNRQYKEGCLSIVALQLCDQDWKLSDFILPLVLQDKVECLHKMLTARGDLVEALVKYLDNLCKPDQDILKIIDELKVSAIQREKWSKKTIIKLAIRLVKRYNLSSDILVHINKSKSHSAVMYMLKSRYCEGNISDAGLHDMIVDTIGVDDTELQRTLITTLCELNHVQEATVWAKHYNIPPHTELYTSNMLSSESVVGGEPGEMWDDDTTSTTWKTAEHLEYYKLHLPTTCIHIVHTEEELYNATQYILKNCSIVGLDAEWKPTILCAKEATVALLQLAVTDRVYLLDIPALLPIFTRTTGKQFIAQILSNPRITKLGYGMSGDFKVFASTLDVFEDLDKKMKKLIDMERLAANLTKVLPDRMFPYKDQDSGSATGLSELVRSCFGHPLDKSEQFSNWENRPLRGNQMTYSALDAYCLLEIFAFWNEQAVINNIPWDKIISTSYDTGKPVVKQPKKDKKAIKKLPPVEPRERKKSPPVSIDGVKFVSDTMLEGLGKKLRLVGVDCVMLGARDPHDKCAQIAMKEDRIILTRGQVYNRLSQYAKCYSVQCDTADDQVREVIREYNIQIKSSDVFTRCGECNGNNYILVPAEDMQTLIHAAAFPSLEGNPPGEDWRYFTGGSIDFNNFTTNKAAKLKIFQKFPLSVMNKDILLFYVCSDCGKVFWEGSHHRDVLGGKLSDMFIDTQQVTEHTDVDHLWRQMANVSTNSQMPAEQNAGDNYVSTEGYSGVDYSVAGVDDYDSNSDGYSDEEDHGCKAVSSTHLP